MKKLLLAFVLLTMSATSQQYLLGPQKLVNGKTYHGDGGTIVRNKNYTYLIVANGQVNVSVRVRALWGDDPSGYLIVDSIANTTGAVHYTTTLSGDDIMNLYIPSSMNPAAVVDMKSRSNPKWKVQFEAVVTGASTGNLTILQSSSDVVDLPPDVGNDSSKYVHRADSVLINGYVTPSVLFSYVAAHSGGAPAIADSLDLELSIGLRLARRISDSLNANPRIAPFDTMKIVDIPHTWGKPQRDTVSGTAYAPAIEFRPRLIVNQSTVPFTVWPTDSSFTPWSLKVIHNPAALVPNDNGYYAESMTLGLNADGAWGNGPRKWGGWLKMGEYFWHGYAAPPDGPIQETHFEYMGENFPTTPIKRSLTWYNYISDGGGRQIEMAFFNYFFHNGSGSAPVSDDSTGMLLTSPRSMGATYTPGTLDMFKSGIRFNTTGATFGSKVTIQRPDSLGTGYGKVWGIEDFGGIRLNFGTETQYTVTSGPGTIPYTIIGARQVQEHFDSPNSRITWIANQYRLNTIRTIGVDSVLGTDSEGNIIKRALPAAGITTTQLRDSLDANPRRDNGKLNVTALTDSLNKFPRGWLNRDTAAIGPTLDGMYARSGGSGGGPDSNRIVMKDLSPNMGATAWRIGTTNTTDSAIGMNMYGGPYRIGFTPNGANGGYTTIVSPGEGAGTQTLRIGFPNYTAGASILWNLNAGASGRENTNYSAGQFQFLQGQAYWKFWNSSGTATVVDYYTYRSSPAKWMRGLLNTDPRFEFDVSGRIRVTDTLRVGDYTTYSYIIPGGALVQSSTASIKRDIQPVDTLANLLDRFMSVNPVRYRFRPTAFRMGWDTSLAGGQWYTFKAARRQAFRDSCQYADSVQAEAKASMQMIGFLAEDLYAQGFTASPNSINQGELVAVLWRVVQRMVLRDRRQTERLDALEARIKLLESR